MTGRKPSPRTPGRTSGVETLEPARQTQAVRRETAERGILEAAKRIVAERGLEDLTLQAAGEAAGYSRALPGHYFKTKAALIVALVDSIIADYAPRVRASLAPGDGMERLLERVGFYIDDAVRDPVTLRVFQTILAAGLTRPDLKPLVTRLNNEAVDGMAALIKRARDKGEIRADARPRAEASIILSSMRGVMFQWLIDPSHVNISTVKESLVRNIRASLAP
jgi:AcrR family transcriptional regulator